MKSKWMWRCAMMAVAVACGVYVSWGYLGKSRPCRDVACDMVSEAGKAMIPAEPMPVGMDESETVQIPPPMENEATIVAVAQPDEPPHIEILDGHGVMAVPAAPGIEVMKYAHDTDLTKMGRRPLMPDVERPAAPHDDGSIGVPMMPYCEDIREASPMPYCKDGLSEESEESGSWWFRWFKMPAGSEVSEPIGPDGMPNVPYLHHHHHDMYCPYTGRCLPRQCSPAVPETGTDCKGKKDECPKKSDSYKISPQQEEQEMNPPRFDVDTLEFRPSDAGWNSLLPGPF